MPDRLAKLVKLGDTDLQLADPNHDIRGRKVIDANGEDVGDVDALFVDEGERKVRFLRVASGGFLGMGATKVLIPVEAVARVSDDTVRVDRTRDRVAAAPAYDPDLIDVEPAELERVYGYYGYTPYWREGHVYPTYPFYV